MRYLFFLSLLFPNLAFAITAVTCPAPDADCDGYTTNGTGLGFDCDDTDPIMPAMPWTRDSCSGLQAKKCDTTTGSFGSCTTPIQGANNYYIDCTSGNDANPGTFASPKKTFLQFSQYINTSPPSGYVDLTAGQTVWFLNGTCTDTYADSPTRPAIYTRRSGTNGNPIRIWGVLSSHAPAVTINVGATCTGATKCPAAALIGGHDIDMRGLKLTGGNNDGTVDAEGAGLVMDGNTRVTIEAMHVTGNQGPQSANPGGINANTGPTSCVISENKVWDNYDSVAGIHENNRQIIMVDGTLNEISYNYIQNTLDRADVNHPAGCIVWKHGSSGASNEVHHNIIENCYFEGIGSGSEATHIHHNLAINTDACVMTHNFGGNTFIRNDLIEYNTCVNTNGAGPTFYHEPEVTSGGNAVNTFRYNILSGNTASFSHYTGSFSVWPDINANWVTYNDGTLISSDNNCFYNAGAATLKFSGGSSDYTFAQWKALGASYYDQHSVNANPTLDSSYRSTANCTSWGWMQVSGGGGAGANVKRMEQLGVGY